MKIALIAIIAAVAAIPPTLIVVHAFQVMRDLRRRIEALESDRLHR